MRLSATQTILIVLLLLFSTSLTKIAIAQPAMGNWVVTRKQVVRSESITLNGNLTVESGGNLTLQNVNLALNVQYDGEYGISVQKGGSLYIRNSTINSADNIHRFVFLVNGNGFAIEASTLHNAGWCDIQVGAPRCSPNQATQYDGTEGLLVKTSGAIITGNRISENGIGMALTGAYDVVRDNTFSPNDFDSIVVAYQRPSKSIFPPFSNDTISGNSFHQDVILGGAMIVLESGGNIVDNNTFGYTQVMGSNTLDAIDDVGSRGNTISNNNITSTGGIFVLGRSSNDVISDNTIRFCEFGVWLSNVGGGNLIENNTLRSGLVKESNGHICGGSPIKVRGAIDLTIARNTILSPNPPQDINNTFYPGPSFILDATRETRVLDNNATWIGQSPLVFLLDSFGDEVAGNRFDVTQNSTWAGFFLEASDNNTITGNQLSSSTPYSIALDSSSDNLVYANDFYGSHEIAYDSGDRNNWSLSGVGNYWESHVGKGAYAIPPNGSDDHPLASPIKIAATPIPVYSPAQFPQQFTGAYTIMNIANDTVIKGITATYAAGNIDVKPGGNLTIEDANMTMGSGAGFFVAVEGGGHLTIVDSTIDWVTGGVQIGDGGSAAFANTRLTVTGSQIDAFSFGVVGTLKIVKSTLQSTPEGGGFCIYGGESTDGFPVTITILNSTLSGGSTCGDAAAMIGMNNDYSNLTIEGSVLKDSSAGIGYTVANQKLSRLTLLHDTFRGLSYPLLGNAGTSVITHNIVDSSTIRFGVFAANVTFDYNALLKSWEFGMYVTCGSSGYINLPCVTINPVIGNYGVDTSISVTSNNTMVANNTATAPQGTLFINGNDNAVYGNSVSGGGGLVLSGSSLEVFGNIINESKNGLSIYASNSRVFDNTIADSQVGVNAHGSNLSIYHNNIVQDVVPAYTSPSGVSWSFQDEGNYWSNYNGSDRDLDGIGDAPFNYGNPSLVAVVTDNYPFVQPNGWLAKFYLTMETNVPSLAFTINGSAFVTGQTGFGIYRLGYEAGYTFGFPQTVALPNGTIMVFSHWSDGGTTPTRTLHLSSNSTLTVTYTESPTSVSEFPTGTSLVFVLIAAVAIVASLRLLPVPRRKIRSENGLETDSLMNRRTADSLKVG